MMEKINLPPTSYRKCNPEHREDQYFIASADREVERLIKNCNLKEGNSVFDVGCGPGRLAIGLKRKFENIKYTGIDVQKNSIDWCNNNILFENYRYDHLTINNARYNSLEKNMIDDNFRFNYSEKFDVIYLFSVFSHMISREVQIYLNEFKRLLSDDGRIFISAFVEDNVENVKSNPDGYLDTRWSSSGALHCVRFNKDFFEDMIQKAGLEVYNFEYRGVIPQQQSAYYLKHK